MSGVERRVRHGGVLHETRHGEDLEATPFLGLLVKRGSLGGQGRKGLKPNAYPVALLSRVSFEARFSLQGETEGKQ